MNKNAYKIIFNKRLGRMDVVSEIVSAKGGSDSGTTGNSVMQSVSFLLKPLSFALILGLTLTQVAYAQIIADPNAPKNQQPTILNTASGATQVNIQTPTQAGVSMNQYQQFDTQNNGTVLNNSRTNTQTQTAGWIQGNPWLATGSARVIVNQVNSNHPSQLMGNIEIAGKRAELIIANPAGININGATILNASRSTFTTGKPIFDNGSLNGFQINQGQINVDGQGLNTSESDYTDILARSMQINAGIWAKQLKVMTGSNTVSAEGNLINVTASNGAAPQFAVDTRALGGMYAGKITLMGTEQGVGVNNAGQIAASAGNVSIDVNGHLSNSGTINSNGSDNQTQIKAQNLHNSGTIASQGNGQIQAGQVVNSGTLTAGKELKVNATDIDNSKGTINAQRVEMNANTLSNTQGKIQQTGTQALDLQSGRLNNSNNGLIGYEPLTGGNDGKPSTPNNNTATVPSTAEGGGSSTVVQPEPVVLADGLIHIKETLNNDAGQITANGGIDLTSNNGLENHATLNLNKLTVTGEQFNNSSGTISTTQSNIRTNSIDNTLGQLGSSGDIALGTEKLINSQGKITASGSINATVTGEMLNDKGTLASKKSATLNTGSLNNQEGVIASVEDGVQLNSQAVNNQSGQIQTAKSLDIKSTVFNNDSGTLKAQTLSLETQQQLLSNHQGKISAEQVKLNTGKLNNDAGLIQAEKELSVHTNGQSLSNTNSGENAGLISGGVLAVQTGELDNHKGSIQAKSILNLSSTSLNNTDGEINATTSYIDTQAQALNNTRGQINSGTLSLKSGLLTNDAGLIQGTDGVTIDTNGYTLSNINSDSKGGILSGKDLSIHTGEMMNNGYIGSKGSSVLSATQLHNSGVIESAGTLDVSANDVNNRSGKIETIDNAHIRVNGTINNDTGLIRSGAKNTLFANTIFNNNTNKADTGIEGLEVTLNANNVDNTSGAIRADQALSINSSGSLNNSNGLISSTKSLVIRDNNAFKTLNVINTDGTIIADVDNNVDVKSITGDGKLLSKQNLNISLIDDLNNSATIQAGNNLNLNSANTINNTAKIITGNVNNITAQNINNSATAEISGKETTLKAIDRVRNHGLIDGVNTLIAAQNVDNIGTGRIYGDHLSIGAKELNNIEETIGNTTKAATIAARENLEIGADRIRNIEHSTLFSSNTMSIGGSLDANNNAVGEANVLSNESATIESLGDMKLAVHQINNLNRHLTTDFPVVSVVNGESIQFSNRTSNRHDAGDLGWNLGDIFPGEYSPSDFRRTYEGGHLGYLHKTDENGKDINLGRIWIDNYFTITTNKTRVLTSEPSKITAGGKISIEGSLHNQDSHIIAGGVIEQSKGELNNDSTKGTILEVKTGKSINRDWFSKRGSYRNRDIVSPINSTAPSKSFDLPTTRYEQNTAPSVSNTTVGTLNIGNVTDNSTGSSTASVNIRNTDTGIASVAAINTKTPTLIKTGEVNTAIPNSSLFSVNPNNSGYFIQTDPRFSNYRNWLSSDWMLSALKLDPTNMHKRLGDGYYEQKIIREQIAQLTGRRYLSGQSNDDEQYKALMNAGVTVAGQYNLRPGIALTAEQMAKLTSDIVWLVTQEITLADGTKVMALVPKVYVAVKPTDIDGTGSLISAENINLNLTGNLDNSGTIAGRNITRITAENLNNLGRISGTQVNLNARTDINNIGGKIDANNNAVITAGRDVNVDTTTSSLNNNTAINRVAGIYVGNGTNELIDNYTAGNGILTTLMIQGGRNVNLTAAEINNDGLGQTLIKAKNDLNISAIRTQEVDNKVADDKNFRKQTITQDIGTNINGVGNIRLDSGNDLNIKASNINSDTGLLIASAGHNVNISTGQHIDDYSDTSYSKERDIVSSSQQTQRSMRHTVEQVSSNLTGNKVVVLAGNDALVKGSNLVSDEGTHVQAGNDVAIVSTENSTKQSHFNQTKKSGFTASFSDGVASVGYSKSKSTTTQDNQNTTQTASTITSLNGNTTVVAGNHVQVTASDIAAGKDIALMGKSVDMVAAQETDVSDSTLKTKSSGFSVGVTYDPTSAFRSAYRSTYQSTPAQGMVGKATRHGDAVGSGYKAATTPIVVTAGSKKSSNEEHQRNSNARVSTVQAGGALKIIATDGSINSQGTQMSAEADALLLAKDNVNLDVTHNYQEQSAHNKASGWNYDNRMLLPGGVYKNKSNGKGVTDTVSGSNLSVGGKATLITQKGDINIIGSNAVATGEMTLNAAHDLNIRSAQNTAQNENRSNDKAVGKVVISDTERFMGYHTEKANSNNQTISQVSANVGSLNGNVNAVAGNKYTQIASNVVAAQDVNVVAKSIDVLTAQNTGDAYSDQKATKVGVFARVSSPIIDLVNNVEAAAKSDGRLQAMQGMAAAGNAYQAKSALSSMKGAGGSGSILKAEAGIGVASNKSSDNSQYSTSIGNSIKAGGNVNLNSTEGNIHLQQTDLQAGEKLRLDSTKNILIESGQSNTTQSGKHSNYGAEVGVGVSVGAQTGYYIYAQANAGKGSNSSETLTQHNSHLNAKEIELSSKGDTTLRGATAKADRIAADVGGKLSIESLQDTAKQSSKDSGFNVRGQISIGTAWEASGSVNSAKANGEFASVTEQSGLFAGEGGYQIKAKEVDLKGGVISSTNAANSTLRTEKLSFSDIENQMNYEATSASLNGSIGGESRNSDGSNTTNEFKSQDLSAPSKGSLTPNIPIRENGQDSSKTRATLTEGNIQIAGQETSAKALGINTDINQAHSGIKNLPDVQKVLADQKAMAAAVSTISSSVDQAISDKHQLEQAKADKIKQDVLKNLPAKEAEQFNQLSAEAQRDYLMEKSSEYTQAYYDATKWSTGGSYKRAADTVTAIVTGLGSGQTGGQVAVNAIAPYAAQIIGNQFDANHGTNPNKAAQVLSHAVLGAVSAYVNGGNAIGGALAGGGSEAAAQHLVKELYPEAIDEKGVFHRERLTEQQVENIVALTNAVGVVAGGVSSGLLGGEGTSVLADASTSGVVAKNAVENNYLTKDDWNKYQKDIKSCQTSGSNNAQCYRKVTKELEEISKKRNKILSDSCSVSGSLGKCLTLQNEAKASISYSNTQLNNIPSGVAKPLPMIIQGLDKNGAMTQPSSGLLATVNLKQLNALAADPIFIKEYKNNAKVREDFKKQVLSSAAVIQQEGRAVNGFMFDKELKTSNINALDRSINFGELPLESVHPELYLISPGIGRVTSSLPSKLVSSLTRRSAGEEAIVIGGESFTTSISTKTTNHLANLVKAEQQTLARIEQRDSQLAAWKIGFNDRVRVGAGLLDASKIPVTINGRTIKPVANMSLRGTPVYKGVSDQEIFALYRQMTGKNPDFRLIPNGKLSNGVINTGEWAGTKVALRNFSSSTGKTQAKWTLDIQKIPNSVLPGNRIELKFQ